MAVDQPFLRYGRHTIEDDDVAAVTEALRGDFLTTGPTVGAFEQAFAKVVGGEFAIACNSGTAALHLALLALDLGRGDSAIVPTLTFVATANVVRMTGAEVVFADVDPESGLITANDLAAARRAAIKAGSTPKVALPVHLNGQVCDMRALAVTASDGGISLVEDACHALGVTDVGTNTYSRMACFSTHPVKAITTCEGGMVITRDAASAARMRRLRNSGLEYTSSFENRSVGSSGDPWLYEMLEIGWNYRLPDVLCALGLSQLRKLHRFHRRRLAIAALYDRLLEPLAPILRPTKHCGSPHAWHLYGVLIDFERLNISRAYFMESLRQQGVGSQVHYIPVHHQPYYSRRYGKLHFPGADAYYARCLSLPIYPAMSNDDVGRVVDVIAHQIAKGLSA